VILIRVKVNPRNDYTLVIHLTLTAKRQGFASSGTRSISKKLKIDEKGGYQLQTRDNLPQSGSHVTRVNIKHYFNFFGLFIVICIHRVLHGRRNTANRCIHKIKEII